MYSLNVAIFVFMFVQYSKNWNANAFISIFELFQHKKVKHQILSRIVQYMKLLSGFQYNNIINQDSCLDSFTKYTLIAHRNINKTYCINN